MLDGDVTIDLNKSRKWSSGTGGQTEMEEAEKREEKVTIRNSSFSFLKFTVMEIRKTR